MRARKNLRSRFSSRSLILLSALAAGLGSLTPPAAAAIRFVRGDANANGGVDISDAVHGLGVLFLGAQAAGCDDARDTNDSGAIDISDPIAVLNFLFLGTGFLPPPYPECGPDSTGDLLTCDVYPPCGEDPDRDTDGDGAIDTVEEALGTDPGDDTDHPAARGWIVFTLRPDAPADPAQRTVAVFIGLPPIDFYLLVDRSGSMTTERQSLKTNIDAVFQELRCPPDGSGDPGDCIPDLWSGLGAIGYAGGEPYRHLADLQPHSALGPLLSLVEPAGCCNEAMAAALWSTLTGQGSAATGCAGLAPYPSRTSCEGSPATLSGQETFGYPCFRRSAVPLIALFTDEPPTTQFACPNPQSIFIPIAQAEGARCIGLVGSDAPGQTSVDLRNLALETGAVDSTGAPLVFDAPDASASAAVEAAVRAAAASLLSSGVSAALVDDGSDGVDAPAAFVARIEVLSDGDGCSSGIQVLDTDMDGIADRAQGVVAGDAVCWRITAKLDPAVAAQPDAQVFHAILVVPFTDTVRLAARDVYFVVPPASPVR